MAADSPPEDQKPGGTPAGGYRGSRRGAGIGGWWRSTVLLLAGSVSAVGGAGAFDYLEHHRAPSNPPIVFQMPAGDVTFSINEHTGHADKLIVSETPTHPQTSSDHDCPPALRRQLERIDFWNEMQDVRDGLELAAKLEVAKNERANEKVDLARGQLTKILGALAGCREEPS